MRSLKNKISVLPSNGEQGVIMSEEVKVEATENVADQQDGLQYKDGSTPEDKVAVLEKRMKDKDSYFGKKLNETETKYQQQISELSSQLSEVGEVISSLKAEKEKLPEKPVLPNEFSLEDGLDPDSQSAKYLKDLDNYNQAVFEKQDKKIQNISSRFEKEEMAKKQAELNRQAREQVVSQYLELGVNETDAERYYRFLTSKDSLSPENTLKYAKMMLDAHDRGAEIDKRQMRANTPPPVAVGGGQHQETLSDVDKVKMRQMNITDESTYLYLKEKQKKINELKNKR